MLIAWRWGRPTVVYASLPACALAVVVLWVAYAIGGVLGVVVLVASFMLDVGSQRRTVRRGDELEATQGYRVQARMTLADPKVVIRPVRRGKHQVTVISVENGDGMARVDVARFAPTLWRLTLRRARRTARALGAGFDPAEWPAPHAGPARRR